MKRKAENETEAVYLRMSVLERQIMGRAGEWELRNGKMWDKGLHSYVMHCAHCKHLFLAGRADKKTCSERCKKARLRRTRKANFAREGEKGQMKLRAARS